MRCANLTHGYTHRAQQLALPFGAGGREHFGAGALRKLYGSHADAAGRRVNEHTIARAHAGQSEKDKTRR